MLTERDLTNSLREVLRSELKFSYDLLLQKYEKEVSFLREEICNKNGIIETLLSQNTMLHGRLGFPNNKNCPFNSLLMRDELKIHSHQISTNMQVHNNNSDIDFNVTDSKTDIKTPQERAKLNQINQVSTYHPPSENNSVKSEMTLTSTKMETRMQIQLDNVRNEQKKRFCDKNADKAIKESNRSSENKSTVKNSDKRDDVILCGDSILNGLDGSGISSKKCKVMVHSFPGSTSEDLKDYIKPLVKKNPVKLIIHVGTNDLTSNINRIDNLTQVVNYVRDNTDTEIVLSNVCKDRISLTLRVVYYSLMKSYQNLF